jgi:hypothetical protein
MREVLSKSLTLRGFINYDLATEHYPAFLRTTIAAVADGSMSRWFLSTIWVGSSGRFNHRKEPIA